jgi:hypothetical protein
MSKKKLVEIVRPIIAYLFPDAKVDQLKNKDLDLFRSKSDPNDFCVSSLVPGRDDVGVLIQILLKNNSIITVIGKIYLIQEEKMYSDEELQPSEVKTIPPEVWMDPVEIELVTEEEV